MCNCFSSVKRYRRVSGGGKDKCRKILKTLRPSSIPIDEIPPAYYPATQPSMLQQNLLGYKTPRKTRDKTTSELRNLIGITSELRHLIGYGAQDYYLMGKTIDEPKIHRPKYDGMLDKDDGMLDKKYMGKSLITLVANEENDRYLVGKNGFTYFKEDYKQHTNFSMETMEIQPQKPVKFGQVNVFNIARNADLCGSMVLDVDIPTITSDTYYQWTPSLGFAMIEYVKLNIADIVIDKHPGEWLKIWYELAKPAYKREAMDKMDGNFPNLMVNNKPPIHLKIPLVLL